MISRPPDPKEIYEEIKAQDWAEHRRRYPLTKTKCVKCGKEYLASLFNPACANPKCLTWNEPVGVRVRPSSSAPALRQNPLLSYSSRIQGFASRGEVLEVYEYFAAYTQLFAALQDGIRRGALPFDGLARRFLTESPHPYRLDREIAKMLRMNGRSNARY